MAVLENFPYTNFHEMNLDWLLSKMRELGVTVDELKAQIADFSPEVQEYVNDWLDSHPDVTTTVQDGAITAVKIADDTITADKLSDSYLQALRGIHPYELKYYTSEIMPGVATQGMTYDTKRDRFILGGFVFAAQSTTQVVAVDNLTDLNILATSPVFSGGHCNALSYDPVNDKIYVASGADLGNNIAVLNADTLAFEGTRPVACVPWVVANDGEYTYVTDYSVVYRYDEYFNVDSEYTHTIDALRLIQSAYSPFTLFGQGGFIHKGILYILFAVHMPMVTNTSTTTTNKGGILAGFDETGRLCTFNPFNLPHRSELEDGVVVGSELYLLTFGPSTANGRWNSFLTASVAGMTVEPPTRNIFAYSDINDVKEVGSYFVANAATAATITNIPDTTSGGSLHILAQNSGSLLAVYIATSGAAYYRMFAEGSNSWTAWARISIIKPTTISNVVMTVGGYVTNNAREVWFEIPGLAGYSNINITALNIQARQGGNYILGTGSASVNVINNASYTVNAAVTPVGVNIQVTATSSLTNAVNNDVWSGRVSISATLS